MKTAEKVYEILLIEDCMRDIRVIVEILNNDESNYHINIAESYENAIAFLNQQDSLNRVPLPDIIFIDINFAEKKGFEIIDFIKKRDDLKIIPVIVLTSSADEEDINRAYKLKANCYIKKPHDVDEYIGIINAIESFWLDGASIPDRSKGEPLA